MSAARHSDARVARIAAWFEALTPADLDRVAEFYADDAGFKDPFNEVQGPSAIRGVFEHMFATLDNPRFVVRESIAQGDQCFIVWDFIFRMRRFANAEQIVRGGSVALCILPPTRFALGFFSRDKVGDASDRRPSRLRIVHYGTAAALCEHAAARLVR